MDWMKARYAEKKKEHKESKVGKALLDGRCAYGRGFLQDFLFVYLQNQELLSIFFVHKANEFSRMERIAVLFCSCCMTFMFTALVHTTNIGIKFGIGLCTMVFAKLLVFSATCPCAQHKVCFCCRGCLEFLGHWFMLVCFLGAIGMLVPGILAVKHNADTVMTGWAVSQGIAQITSSVVILLLFLYNRHAQLKKNPGWKDEKLLESMCYPCV